MTLKHDSQYSNVISDYLHCSQVKILLKMLLKLLSLHPNSISLTMTLSWWPSEWQILAWLLKLKQFKMQCITNIIFQPNFGDSQRWFPQDGFQLRKLFGQVQSGRSNEMKWVGPQIRAEVVSLEPNQDVLNHCRGSFRWLWAVIRLEMDGWIRKDLPVYQFRRPFCFRFSNFQRSILFYWAVQFDLFRLSTLTNGRPLMTWVKSLDSTFHMVCVWQKSANLKPNRSGPGSYKIFQTLEITCLIVQPDILDYTEETHCYYRLE